MPMTSWRRREPTAIADLGPIGIMREAFRQFWTYIVHFLLIQLTLILPVVGVFAAVENNIVLAYDPQPVAPAPSAHFLRLPKSEDRVSFLFSGDLINARAFQPVLLISLLASLAFQSAQGLSTSAILLSVGFIYSGQKVSFAGVLKSAIPILWLRLTVTTIYNVCVSHSIILLETAALLVLLKFQTAGIWGTILKVVIAGAFGLADLFLGVVFGVALGVSVLEEAYGWAAFKKALNLLKGKGRVAIWFHVVWSRTVPTVITFALNRRGGGVQAGISKQGDYRSWSPTPLLVDYLNAVLFVSWTTLFWQLSSLCAGVQYVSFKAYHRESLEDSRLFQERSKAGHCRIGAESGHAAAGAANDDVSNETGTRQTQSSVARSDS